MSNKWRRIIVVGLAILVVLAFGMAAVLSIMPGTIGDEASGSDSPVAVTAMATVVDGR